MIKEMLPKLLFGYAGFLILIALLAVMYSPAEGRIGWNPAAKTALMSGGMAAFITIVWAVLLSRGMGWSLIAGIATTGLFMAVFIWRATVSWQAYTAGASDKWYAATLITSMAVASLATVALLVKGLLETKS